MVTTIGGFSSDDSLGLGPIFVMNLSKSFNRVADTSKIFGKVQKTFSILSFGVSKVNSLSLVQDIAEILGLYCLCFYLKSIVPDLRGISCYISLG